MAGGAFTTAGWVVSTNVAQMTTTCPATAVSYGAGCTGSGGLNVLEATTLPTLLLGGDPGNRSAEVFEGWRRALRLPQVRGLVAGRALLYPPGGDVATAVAAAAKLVHG